MGPLCKRVCDLCAEPGVESNNGVNNVEESHSWSFSVGGKYAWRLLFLLSNKCIFSEAAQNGARIIIPCCPTSASSSRGTAVTGSWLALLPQPLRPQLSLGGRREYGCGNMVLRYKPTLIFFLLTKAIYVHYLKTRKHEQKRSLQNYLIIPRTPKITTV